MSYTAKGKVWTENDITQVRGADLRVGSRIAPPPDRYGVRRGNPTLIESIVPCNSRDKIHVNKTQCYDLIAFVEVVS